MYTIKAIYDGTNFKCEEPIFVKEQYNVLITFVEPVGQPEKKAPRPEILRSSDPSKSALGLWEGEITVPDDFDEPLEDLMGYMH